MWHTSYMFTGWQSPWYPVDCFTIEDCDSITVFFHTIDKSQCLYYIDNRYNDIRYRGEDMARKEFQTLTEQMFYILLVLQKPHHGYEIMQRIEEISHERVKVGAGTLYTLLARFEEEGYIKRVGEDNRKKTYQITVDGKALFEKEKQRLMQMLEDSKEVAS